MPSTASTLGFQLLILGEAEPLWVIEVSQFAEISQFSIWLAFLRFWLNLQSFMYLKVYLA